MQHAYVLSVRNVIHKVHNGTHIVLPCFNFVFNLLNTESCAATLLESIMRT